jgi:integrase
MTSVPSLEPELGSTPYPLGDTQQAVDARRELHAILSRNGVSASMADLGPYDWTQSKINEFEKTLGTRIRKPDELALASACLRILAAAAVSTGGPAVPLPRSIHRVRLEANPFRGDVGSAMALIDQMRKAICLRIHRLRHIDGSEPHLDPRRILALILLSSVLHLLLLDESLLLALLDALCDRQRHALDLQRASSCWVLSAAWRNQPDAERRLYVPDRRTARLISVLTEDQVRNALTQMRFTGRPIDQRRKLLRKIAGEAIGELLPDGIASSGAITLESVLRAARICVHLHAPSVVAALRSRRLISHSAPLPVLKRLVSRRPISLTKGRPQHRAPSSSPEIDQTQADAEAAGHVESEPRWLVQMRVALRAPTAAQSRTALANIGHNSSDLGSRMAEFARHLMSVSKLSQSSASRYGLLIARRLGCRLGDIDPATLTVQELEDLYEDALEDDWDGSSLDESAQSGQRSKRATAAAISAFHRFLQDKHGLGQLEELKDRLKPQGLLPVDANFISIDEYCLLRKQITRDGALNDPYLRGAVRAIAALCFWCGLRRNEAMFLRTCDLDRADHLHVRPHALRKLKTSNANRTLPLAILLPEAEFAELKQWIRSRSEAGNECAEALVFSQADNVLKPLHGDWIFNTITRIMRTAIGDDSLKIHHLRHSFATLLAAKLLPNMEGFSSLLLRQHPLTGEWLSQRAEFRARLFGTASIRSADLRAIAHLLGHSSPGMSLEHYIHCLDWCNSDRVRKLSPRRIR